MIINKYCYEFLGQFLALPYQDGNPIASLFEEFDNIHIYGDTPEAHMLWHILTERRLSCSMFTREVKRLRSLLGGHIATGSLSNLLLKKRVHQSSVLLITGEDITKRELLRLKKIYQGNVILLEDAVKEEIVIQGFYKPIEKYITKKQLKISLFYLPPYSADRIAEPSEWEAILNTSKRQWSDAVKEKAVLLKRNTFHEGFTEEQYNEIAHKFKMRFYNDDGIIKIEDIISDIYNIKNNERYTIGQPEEPDNHIWILGNSKSNGQTIDSETMPSHLQKIINCTNYPQKWAVHNCPRGGSYTTASYFPFIESLPIKDGDIVLFMTSHDLSPYFETIEYRGVLERPHDLGEIFLDQHHVNGIGNKAIAEFIFHQLDEKKCFTSGYQNRLIPLKNKMVRKLDKWLSSIADLKPDIGKTGAIVMNCNPFTLGHRYLIEYAAKRVDHLFIFVVQEDKSIFPFQDRFDLVKAGTSALQNVIVLPSGQFIISRYTFGQYFDKAQLQEQKIDPSYDVALFANYIAPVLGITIRFAGEEPLDFVTKQYNDAMHRILPQNGIEFAVIPRKENDGEVISASRVRRLLADQDFKQIAEIVPDTTLQYLIEKYGNQK